MCGSGRNEIKTRDRKKKKKKQKIKHQLFWEIFPTTKMYSTEPGHVDKTNPKYLNVGFSFCVCVSCL